MFNIAVIVNTLAVLVGGSLGTIIGNKLPENFRIILFHSVGLTTLLIGIGMGLEANNLIVVLVSLALGSVVGELLKIENGLGKLANIVERSEGETPFVKGFITATVLFVIGPMTIIGCLNAGLTGDNSVIFLKSVLDGISSIVLASVYSVGVIFSAVSVFLVQGAIVSLAGLLSFLSNPYYLNDFTAVGGAMVIAIGIRLLEIKDIKVGNFLPALIIVVLINYILTFFAL
ncbi:DUF554 domain-containing protein [Petrotoga sp. 9PWA.NaAc.5.4]|uniref:DUF554 domain-containing protein n=1 Tax=Petrotoga sp. 9PWA.NaAc.5.4 TaxID=1434328 RepID=UPI000CC7FC6F|nr:DUF554 domain-containing protein [Petrotoga sp. 9PWA.NaAc.5.4]PNR93387.1 membrane protein [Petrotoga sp. 9PWA.NaAc.5.4]